MRNSIQAGRTWSFLLAGIVLTGGFLESSLAGAASLGGWSGKATDPTLTSCFVLTNGVFQPNSVRNICGTASYDLPLLLNTGGSHTVTVAATSPSSMPCTLFGLNQNGTIQSQQSGNISSGTINLTVNVTGLGGSALLRCAMPNGASITSLNYNL
jgi:hypothetical protein